MIDLAKPLGIHNDLIFYGDHELPDLVYYFPDEVKLAIQPGSPVDTQEFYELLFQIFHEGTVSTGGIDELRKTAGSILQLGVQCKVGRERLDIAVESLKSVHIMPENLRVTTPHWKDGSVNLIALDASTLDPETIGDDAFVKSVVGTHKPSLMSADLKSIFNVRFDRRGTALISSALDGAGGSVAGILYDLKYVAIRPAVDLRIRADLGRCYESISHELGVKIEFEYYVKFSLGAEFEWLTKKLEENGDLVVELLSQVDDPETKKLVDEMVKEFKESILKELFRPYVNPSVPDVINMTNMAPEIGVSYVFKKEKIEHGKIIEVDYRERSTTVRTHNPQSHLWVFGRQIAGNRDRYVKKVVFSELWKEQELQINLENDFDNEQNDLLSAEVIVWRKKDGLAGNVLPGRFSIPPHSTPIKNITFHKDFIAPVKFSWLYDEGEEIGYYYQVRFLYSDKIKNISSPREIITDPIESSNQNLIIFPDTLVFFKLIEVRSGNISFTEFTSVDVVLHLKDSQNELVDVEVITLTETNKNEEWVIRMPAGLHPFVEAYKEFHFIDNSPSIKTEPVYLVDDEIIVNRPLQKSAHEVIPVIAGKADNVREILLTIILNSPALDEPVTMLHRITGPDFKSSPLNIKLNSADDTITYEAVAITTDGKLVKIGSGSIKDNVFVIDLNKLQFRNVTFIWEGPSPAACDLKYLRIDLRTINEMGQHEELESIEYKGDVQPEDVVKSFDRALTVQMSVLKRFFDGSTEKGQFGPVLLDKVIIRA